MEAPAGNAFAKRAVATLQQRAIEVWEDNVPAYTLFTTVMTQWRIGMSGAIGLDYGAVYPVMERMRLDDEAWRELLTNLQVMEAQALAIFRRSKK